MAGVQPAVTVRPMTAAHAEGVLAVFAEGIATGHATFESAAPTWAAFDASHLPEHRFVALETVPAAPGGPAPGGPAPADDAVLGWVAASPVSRRAVYAGVVEASLYVGAAARGRGVGRALMAALLASAEAGGVWTVQSTVFPENAGSLALHAAAGFRVVGRRERIARMTHGPLAGEWRDVVLLERRL
ncbi:GNAT family N-acetyltransferase [Cellulomonas sp.]|uniref:GNAT family N-acetyltransferase n=1 Tax=Cellulomonas sp. TaxID=40001 RepID=UPI002D6D0602|nr:GNAT family N-acetyltransferase [Cellulomonas sp.]HYQ76156.1 GNAT family N-acetyltransferase [Cellulomonas sp.]